MVAVAVVDVVVVCWRRSGNATTRRLRRQRQRGLQLQQLRVHLKYSARHLAALLARKKARRKKHKTNDAALPLPPRPYPFPSWQFFRVREAFQITDTK